MDKKKSLPCVCGHDEKAHPCVSICGCKDYRPCITLSDLQALLKETREEVSMHKEMSVKNHFERVCGAEVLYHALKRKFRALEGDGK